jgi:hypothetical protein
MNEYVVSTPPKQPGGINLDPQQKFSLRLVEDGDYTYIGQAQPGVSETTPRWRIFRMDSATGLKIEWASGNAGFDKKWSDYATLIYS